MHTEAIAKTIMKINYSLLRKWLVTIKKKSGGFLLFQSIEFLKEIIKLCSGGKN